MKSIRGSHLEWEASKADKYAEKWWTEHGYAFELKKRYQSKSTYTVSKDEIVCDFDIFRTDGNKSVADEATQMKTFERTFEGLREVTALRQKLKESRNS